ncbi:transposase-like protein [Colletotrichum sojae]|nr:transposase-like protein [Colletotrichum sojae]
MDWGDHSPQSISRFGTLDDKYQQHLRSSIEQAWQKLFQYYSRLGESPLFAASIILHPSLGYSYLEDIWDAEHQVLWCLNAKEGLVEYFNKWYRHRPPPDSPTPVGILPIDLPNITHEDSHFRQWVNSRRRQPPAQPDEVDIFLRQPSEPTPDPVKWWMEHRETYPQLSQFALDVFAIPAMAADCERAFSSAKLTLTSQRLRMKPGMIEKLQLTKNWLKRGTLLCGKGDMGLLVTS